MKLVVPCRDKVVTATEVLAAGSQPSPNVETVIVTLMHLAFYSDRIEFEVLYWLNVFEYTFLFLRWLYNLVYCKYPQAVFMMCAISAIDPCQRCGKLISFTSFPSYSFSLDQECFFLFRELVRVALDNLSKNLQYVCRSKVMNEVDRRHLLHLLMMIFCCMLLYKILV